MAKNLYPRVEISTTAKRHSAVRPTPEDTTSILALCIAEKGPTDITAVHSLAEFTEKFGELKYATNGQTALNIYNWLANGGTAYVKRFTSKYAKPCSYYKDGTATETVTFQSKYPGEYYLGIKIILEIDGTEEKDKKYTITVVHTEGNHSVTIERFYRVKKERLVDLLADSEYIALGDSINLDTHTFAAGEYYVDSETNGLDSTIETKDEELLEDRIKEYFGVKTANGKEEHGPFFKEAENKLLTPFELILGAGYSLDTDKAIHNALVAIRDDVIFITDTYQLNGKLNAPTNKKLDTDSKLNDTHVAEFGQYFKIYDNIFTDSNMFVTTTYFLSQLIPYNDNLYGIQNAVAGLRRGVLSGALEIHDNLTSADKNEYFKNRINYTEKTTREYAIMGNRTYDGSTEDNYTALSFLNNVRVLERMKKEIERLAREYLFEFNDGYTLSQLSSILNKYVTEWIVNRTLNMANVTVAKDQYSDEQIDIGLNIRFNGTVEVIHVDIVIE